jgi:hypothetical protein
VSPEDFFVAADPTSVNLRRRALELAATDLPVLIVGPNGSGRRRLAELMYQFSERRDRPRRILACPELTDIDWAGRLFGGADAGAEARPGLLEQVGDGTLILAGLHAAPRTLVKAVGNLLDGNPLNLDDTRCHDLRCRILATATPGDHIGPLGSLFPRHLELRPLAQRPQDVLVLIPHLLGELAKELGKELAPPDEDQVNHLGRLPWNNGEVQELRRALRYAVQAATDCTFRESLLPDWVQVQLAGPALPLSISKEDPTLSLSDRLAVLVCDVTLGLLELGDDFQLPAFALRCSRQDFQLPIIRELIQGTLAACTRFLGRNVRDVKAGKKPILGLLPPAGIDGEPAADEDDLVAYFRATLEQRIRSIRELPEDTEDDLVAEIANAEPERDQMEVASQAEVEAYYEKIAGVYASLDKHLPGREQMVEIIEKHLLKKVNPTYVSNVRKKRGDGRGEGGKTPRSGSKVGLDVALENEGFERHRRDRRAGTDAQSQVDRRLASQDKFKRMDAGERAFAASQIGISLASVTDAEEQVDLLVAADQIRQAVNGYKAEEAQAAAKACGISTAGVPLPLLREQVFKHLWQNHLAGHSHPDDE